MHVHSLLSLYTYAIYRLSLLLTLRLSFPSFCFTVFPVFIPFIHPSAFPSILPISFSIFPPSILFLLLSISSSLPYPCLLHSFSLYPATLFALLFFTFSLSFLCIHLFSLPSTFPSFLLLLHPFLPHFLHRFPRPVTLTGYSGHLPCWTDRRELSCTPTPPPLSCLGN